MHSIEIIPKRDRHYWIQYNPLPDIRKPDVPKRKRSSGLCVKCADTHREFPITLVPVDVPTPGHLVRCCYYYYSQSDIILLFFIPKRTRRRHCDTHARTHYTRVSTIYGTMGRFPTDTLNCRTYMPVDDDPFPLRSTLFRTLAPATPFMHIFLPWHLAIVWPTRAS